MSIDIDDQSGQEVAFAVDEPESGVVGADEFQVTAQLPCLAKAFSVKSLIDGTFLEGKDADGDAPCLGMADAEELVLRRIDGSLVAFFYALAVGVFNMIDGAGEYPRMETFQGFFLAGFEESNIAG